MKKGLLLLTALVSLNAVAGVEVQLKGGYDVFRRQANEDQFFSSNEVKNGDKIVGERDLQRGFVLNAELFPVNQYKVELGAGVEYNFNNKTYGYGFEKVADEEATKEKRVHHIPFYGIIKANVLQAENGDSPLAIVGKLGYAFVRDVNKSSVEKPGQGGLYYAVGVNGEYGPFVVEALASRTHIGNEVLKEASNGTMDTEKSDVINKVGLTAGFRVGQLDNTPAPVVEKPVEVVKPEVIIKEVIVEKPVEVIKEVIVEKPVVKEVEAPKPEVYVKALNADGLFKFDKYALADLLPEGRKEIENLAAELNNVYSKVFGIEVIGHTDRLGSDAYNMKLGQRRADTIKKLLQDLGVTANIKASSKGESEPLVYSNNKNLTQLKKDLQPNRRVEVKVEGVKIQYTK
ncbi:OmpA family protein [Pseudostreptobacillus hongkongensis]|uniref:OmpA family protein n=1 Tax=Pseudostreptobacillus hongkongensis TaxID=1162717 RepID=UPI0028D51326|nr:OmpA family protein [Pseudostreptobacillus hongkongensis]